MAKNEVFRDADHLSLPVPDGTGSGVPVIVGGVVDGLVGITETKEGEGGNADNYATVWLKGAHKVPVTGAVATIGLPIYIPPAGGALTTTATNNALWGNALETKGSGTGTITVRIRRV